MLYQCQLNRNTSIVSYTYVTNAIYISYIYKQQFITLNNATESKCRNVNPLKLPICSTYKKNLKYVKYLTTKYNAQIVYLSNSNF